ncbi:DUF481 domain-containing protein [bacterium]|nr:DUF481 domain-containing protein [bacterium]MBU1989907.1 DUF481 domain-containing protein [bacterium]
MKLLLILLINITSLMALITITPVDIGEKPGFSTKGAVSLETKKGNTEKSNYKGSVRLSYDDNLSYVTWAEFSGEYGETNTVKDTNNLYSHVRHIRKLEDYAFRTEYFAQLQSDEFKKIEDRALGGAGLRYKLPEILKDSKAYIGVGGFYEYINYSSIDPYENNIRVNTYFAYTIKLEAKTSLSYTLYYQPKIDDFYDYACSNKAELKIHVYKKLFLSFNLYYDIDSRPAMGLKTDDYGQLTNFIFEF